MDDIATVQVAIFLAGVFVAAFVTALAGFAFGMVVAGYGCMPSHRSRRQP